jgi:acyl carrier protein
MNPANLDKFRQIVSAVLGVPVEQVTDELSAEKIDTWDSLNHINLVSALEQEFQIMLPTETMAAAQSVPSLKALLGQHGIQV